MTLSRNRNEMSIIYMPAVRRMLTRYDISYKSESQIRYSAVVVNLI